MPDVTELGVVTRTSGVEQTTKQLSDLEKQAHKTADAADKLGNKTQGASGGLGDVAAGAAGAGMSIGRLAAGVAGGVLAFSTFEMALRAVYETLRQAAIEYAAQEQAIFNLEKTMRLFGNTAGLSSAAMMDFANELEEFTTVAETDILKVQGVFLRFGRVTGDSFKEATRLALDLSSVLGRAPVDAAELLARAMNGSERGVAQLRNALVELSPAMAAQIDQALKAAQQSGDFTGVLETLRDTIGGQSEAGNTLDAAWKRSTDRAGDFWKELLKATGATDAMKYAANSGADTMTRYTETLKAARGPLEGITMGLLMATEQLASYTGQVYVAMAAEAQLEQMRQRTVAAQFRNGTATTTMRGDQSSVVDIREFAAQAEAARQLERRLGDLATRKKDFQKDSDDAANAELANIRRGTREMQLQSAAVAQVEKEKREARERGIEFGKDEEAAAKRRGRMLEEEKIKIQEAEQAANRRSSSRTRGLNQEERAQQTAQRRLDEFLITLQEEAATVGMSTVEHDTRAAMLQAEAIATDSLGRKVVQLTEAYKRQIAEAIKARESARADVQLKSYVRDLEEEVKLLRVEGDEREELAAILQAENALRDANGEKIRDLTAEEENRIRALVREKQELEAVRQAQEEVADAWTDFITDLIQGSDNALEALAKFLAKLVEIWIQMQLMKSGGGDGMFGGILDSIFGGASGGPSGEFFSGGGAGSFTDAGTPLDFGAGFAHKGKVFGHGEVVPFGRGGRKGGRRVSRPTMEPMALMGEQGEEGVFPLARDASGNLGIRGGGGGGSKVTVQVFDQRKSGAAVETEERRGPNGEMQIRLFIRDEVSRAISDGSMDRSLSKNYGINRNPTRRS